ncbi:MAG: dihydrolipoyl dehydrogenase [Deltaproteobacteria bacterium]|nr:dihydrolipoyl dehydrogenase [Deltaproteobacteria bacterium]
MAKYDFIILGAGPGGYVAALRAALLKAKVALIEKESLGGVCMNWGCIPTKALYRCAKLYQEMEQAQSFGLECSGLKADLAAMSARKDKIVLVLTTALAKLLAQRKVDVFNGFGYLLDPNRVQVIGPGLKEVLEARFIILATGTECSPHPVVEVDNKQVHDVKSILQLTEVPKHLFVIGGGVSGCEFAQVFSALGSKITMTKRSKAPIKELDADIEKTLVRTFKKRKYRMLFGDSVNQAQVTAGGLKAVLGSGQEVEADLGLVTVGHRPLTYEIGLEEAGLELDRAGHVKVDDRARTNIEHIYAIGDVTGQHLLAHFASHMGLTAVHHALGDKEARVNPEAVPKAVFTDPELAWVGLTEAQAKDRFGQVKCGQFLIRTLGRSTADGHLDGLVKVVAQGDKDIVVGVHILGPDASSLIAEGTLAVNKGLTLKDLAQTIHAHPTYPEALHEAVETALGLPIHNL